MVFPEEDLRKRLGQLEREELTDLISRLYRCYPEVQGEINRFAVTKDESEMVLGNIGKYTPGECKTALSRQVKSIRDKKEKVLFYYSFIDEVLDKRDILDYRFISVASASFGKAMDILEKNRELWDEMIDRSYEIATRFYEMEGAVPYKAVEYYIRVKRGFDAK